MRAQHQHTQHTETQTQTKMRFASHLFGWKYVQCCTEGQERETFLCVGRVKGVTSKPALASYRQSYKHPLIPGIPFNKFIL